MLKPDETLATDCPVGSSFDPIQRALSQAKLATTAVERRQAREFGVPQVDRMRSGNHTLS
jgi:hypothetical protein